MLSIIDLLLIVYLEKSKGPEMGPFIYELEEYAY